MHLVIFMCLVNIFGLGKERRIKSEFFFIKKLIDLSEKFIINVIDVINFLFIFILIILY